MLWFMLVPANSMMLQLVFKSIMKEIFNRECWLMLVGFPLDYWSVGHISKSNAIKNFGTLLVWEKDLNNLARTITKARVIDLENVPKSI